MIIELYDLLYSLHASYTWNDDVKNNSCEGSQDGGDHSGRLVVSRNSALRGRVTAGGSQAADGDTGLAGWPTRLPLGGPHHRHYSPAQPRSMCPSSSAFPANHLDPPEPTRPCLVCIPHTHSPGTHEACRRPAA